MTGDQLLVLVILGVALVVFATDRLRVDVVALSVLVTLVLTGVLESEEALSGLSNPAVVTVFAVFVLSGALVRTGVADHIATLMLTVAGHSFGRVVTVLMLTCGLMSAFMNNIGATAILLPAALVVSERTGIAASRLLMPLAFASLLGGNLTAIGTPPNILANGILADRPGLEPFGFFDFTPTGVPVLLIGVAYMATLGAFLLPVRRASGRVADDYKVDDYLSTVTIGEGSALVGLSVAEARVEETTGVRLLAIRRTNGHVVTPRRTTRFVTGDRLTVQADLDGLRQFRNDYGEEIEVDDAVVAWTDPVSERTDDGETINLAEVIVAPDSRLIGRTVGELELRRRRGLVALALRRRRGQVRTALSRIRLRAGDSLVVTGADDRLAELLDSPEFIAVSPPNLVLRRTSRAPLAIVVVVAVLACSALGLVPIAIAMLTGALLLVVTGALSMEEAYESVDWRAIFLIAGMLPLGLAMEQTGTAALLAERLLDITRGGGTLWVLVGIYVLTVAVTSVISNAAATVLIVPIALDAAEGVGASPEPFVMAAVIAASTAFLLPIGHQVNILVYGPGRYRFSDFARVGGGLTLAIMALVVVLVPVIWPF